MRFAHKLTLVVIVILAVALSISGYFTIAQNFKVAVERAVSQNTTLHLMERYSIKSQLDESIKETNDDSAAALRSLADELSAYIGGRDRFQAIYDQNSNVIFDTIPDSLAAQVSDAVESSQGQVYTLMTEGSCQYMVFISTIEGTYMTLTVVSAYDISSLYAERLRQMQDTLKTNALVLVVASIAVIAASVRMTRPIRRLNRISKRIARGAFDARTDVITDDEIGELSGNFNQMAAAVETQVEQLNLSVQQREDFVSAFTHEIKTPMTAIIGYADVLRFKENCPEVRQKAAQFIYREAHRLELLSQKLLLLMGLSERKAELQPVSLERVFRDTGRSVLPVLSDKSITLRAAAAKNIMVKADADLLVDLLRNLILNAIKAEPKDQAVYLYWRREGDHVRITVEDFGKGIPEDEQTRIMEPFYMVNKSRARREGGSGIGLSLCQRICELHHSRLRIQSQTDQGTAVSFALPRLADGLE